MQEQQQTQIFSINKNSSIEVQFMLAKNPAFNLTISLVMKQEDGFTKINSKKTEEKKKESTLAAIQHS